jgi:hypothetical protein
MMMQILTTAQHRGEAERCRRLARGINDPLTTKLLAALAEHVSTVSTGSSSNASPTPNNTKLGEFKREIGNGSFTKSKAPDFSEALYSVYLRPPAELGDCDIGSATAAAVNLSI